MSENSPIILPGAMAPEQVTAITPKGKRNLPPPKPEEDSGPVLNIMDYDPWAKPKAVMPREAKTFTCPRYGIRIKLELQGLDPIQQSDANIEAQKLSLNYVEAPAYSEEQATDFLGPDEKEYELNAAIVSDIATIQAMICGPSPAFTWWIGIITRHPEMFNEIKNFAGVLNNKVEVELRKKQMAKELERSVGNTSN